MTPIWDHRLRMLSAGLACFCAGAITDAALRIRYNAPDEMRLRPDSASEVRSTPERTAAPDVRLRAETPAAVVVPEPSPMASTAEVSHSGLRVPIDGVSIESLKGGFDEHRGARPHEAVDILAPRATPVHAVTSGTVAKLFYSDAGGKTIYQFDPEGRLCYYYAHLDGYVDGLHDGQAIAQGDVIGYVGTTGNAAPDTPHLHFAVFELDAERRWWKGRALDPYEVFKDKG
jgi:murein DD-endopeptidase MepM/ murein hydrolase activator NlpD